MGKVWTKEETEQLERLIDAHGLSSVLGEIDLVCHGKAGHIREAWNDEGLARDWERAGRTADRAARWVDRFLR